MTAKIKARNPYGNNIHKHKPRGVSAHAFEKAYWPFLPVLLITGFLLFSSIRSGTLASYISHPVSKVLAYATSQDSEALLLATNYQRQANNESPLSVNYKLTQAAQAKAKDMATRDYWSHITPDGSEPWIFVKDTNYSYQKLGENLATGFSDEGSVVKAWMASKPHRENLLDSSFTEVGFGFANIKDYAAIGGGEMTIVVAFYGRPASLPFASSSTNIITNAPTTDNKQLTSATLASDTLRAQLAFYKHQASSWGPLLVAFCIGALSFMIFGKHLRAIKRALNRGEKFIWRHPMFDLMVLLLIAILAVFTQTAGYIQ